MKIILDSNKKELHIYNCLTNDDHNKLNSYLSELTDNYTLYVYYPGSDRLKYIKYI